MQDKSPSSIGKLGQLLQQSKNREGLSTKWREKNEELVGYEKAIGKRVNGKATDILGSGSRGIAFKLDNGKVLKLTDDATEASASKIIMNAGNTCPNIVHIYDVFQLGDLYFYGIVLEELEKTPSMFKDLISYVSVTLHNCKILKTKNELTKIKQFVANLSSRAKKEEIAKQLVNGTRALYKLNINFTDLHIYNTGMKNGQIKIMDIGWTKSPPTKIPIMAAEQLSFKAWYHNNSIPTI